MATKITPQATHHEQIDVPQNNINLADAAWMAMYTWKQLGDNAKYALDQIDVKIGNLKADDNLVFSGEQVTFEGDASVGGDLDVTGALSSNTLSTGIISAPGGDLGINANLTLGATTHVLSGGRRAERTRIVSSWPGTPPTATHAVTQGAAVLAEVGAASVDLRLLSDNAVDGDWVRITLGASGGTVEVYNGEDESVRKTLSSAGAQVTLTYFESSGWQVA